MFDNILKDINDFFSSAFQSSDDTDDSYTPSDDVINLINEGDYELSDAPILLNFDDVQLDEIDLEY